MLINLEGLALIGPGSEWFWSMLQFVVVAITLVAIFQQVRLQASAGAIGQAEAIARDWSSEPMARHRLAVLLALQSGVNPELVPGNAAAEISNFWERTAYLVRAGHIDRRLVHQYFSANIALWWAWLEPNNRMERARRQEPDISEHFEWLAGVIAAIDEKAGAVRGVDEKRLANMVPLLIETNRDAIRTAEELRSVVLRPRSLDVAQEEPPEAPRK